MSDYSVTLHLWKSGFPGHLAAEIKGPDGESRVIGFGPAGPLKSIYGRGNAARPDDANDIGRKLTNPSQPLPLTKDQFDKLNRYADGKEKSPGMYHVTAENCVEYVVDGLRQAGVDTADLPARFTPEQLAQGGPAANVLIERTGTPPDDAGGSGINDRPADPAAALREKYLNPRREPEGRGEGERETGKEAPKSPEADLGDWSPGPADPLAKRVEDWTAEDAARAMVHRDYGRDDSPSGPLRHRLVTAYFQRPDSGDVKGAITKEIEALRPRLPAPAGSFSKLREELLAGDHPGDDVALKPVADWTRDEARQVTGLYMGLPDRDPRREILGGLAADWYARIYGDAPFPQDETGRPREPRPQVPIPRSPKPLLTADGKPLDEGLLHVGRKLAEATGPDPKALPGTVRALQGGLNLLGGAGLDEDGILGPQTRSGLKRTLVEGGTTPVERALAVGRFRDTLRRGRPADLEGETETAFAGLHPQPGLALQKTLNGLGPKAADGAGWTPLKEDGWIGPRTTEAFAQVAGRNDPDDFARSFARNLWPD
ncbi:MAG: hypothetical protein H7841_17525 [Magnetospirillum sp. WYHS-4]